MRQAFCVVISLLISVCPALAQGPVFTPSPAPAVMLESDGSSNGPVPVTVCGFVYLDPILGAPTISASWRSLSTGVVRSSAVSTKLPRPDLSKALHLSSSDLGWCTVAPITYGEGNWQVTITAAPPPSALDATAATYSFTVTAPVDAIGNPIASFIAALPQIQANQPFVLSGYVYDRTAAAAHVDGIASVSIVARDTAAPASAPSVIAPSVPLTHYADANFPAAATWAQTVMLQSGVFDLTVTSRSTNGAVNRQMVRVVVE
jgi:hypothetical protein